MLPANWRKAWFSSRDRKSTRGKRKALFASIRGRCKNGVFFEPLEQRMLLAVFLQGNYMEVGIHPLGSLGTTDAAPGTFHNGNFSLGFIADRGRDGWAVGSPPRTGDYFTPGIAEEGWSLDFKGPINELRHYENYGLGIATFADSVPVTSLTDTSAGNTRSALWVGSAVNGNETLEVRQELKFDINDLRLVFSITLTNTGSVPLHDIEYMRGADPDQEVTVVGAGSAATINHVKKQPPLDSEALVVATGVNFGIPLGLGTIDLDANHMARASTEADDSAPERNPSEILDSPSLGNATTPVNQNIELAYRFTTLAPGHSITFKYYYSAEGNAPPNSEASGPYTVAEGGSTGVTGTFSLDPEGGEVTYEWDLDGDGTFGETGAGASYGNERGATPTFNAFTLDGPSSKIVTLRAIDPLGASSTDTATVTITNVAPIAAAIVATTPVNEGTSLGNVSLALPHTDPSIADVNETFHFAFDFDNNGTFDEGNGTYLGSGGNSTVFIPKSFVDDGPSTKTVRARIIDKDNGFTDYTTTIVVNNVAPTAGNATVGNLTLSSPIPVDEGVTGVTVTVNAPFDPSGNDTTVGLRYSFDFDGNGTFDMGNGTYASSGSSPTVTIPPEFLDDGPTTYTILARIIDKNEQFNDYTTLLTVKNLPPTAVLTSNGPTYRTSTTATVTFSNQTDPSGPDGNAGFKYSYDWNNDGDFGDAGEDFETTAFANVSIPSSYLATAGNIPIRAQIHDKDGGVTDYVIGIMVHELTTISGQKFADVNSNGAKDPDELGLDEFEIRLRNAQGVVIASTFTDSFDVNLDGNVDPLNEGGLYKFTNLIPGNYTIEEVVPTGWQRTYPGGSGIHQVTVPLGTALIPNLDFGNRKLTGEIHGAKFSDLNNNGVRDGSILAGDNPDVIFIIDVSGSTVNQFRGSPVFNQNGDPYSNTILDAEIAAFKALNQKLIDLGFGTTSRVSIVAFDTNAQILDMNLGSPGTPTFTHPSTLVASNPADRDVDEVLENLQLAGVTNFAGALAKATQIITTPGGNYTRDNTNVIFLSDGIPNTGGAYNDEVAALRLVAANVRAFGVGNGTSLTSLQIIDPQASIFTTTDQLLGVFNGTGSTTLASEPGLNNWEIQLLYAGNNTIYATQFTHDIDLNGDSNIDPFSERGLYRFFDLPEGNYTVREVQQAGWVQTKPAGNGTYQVTISPGEINTNIDFGNFQLNEVSVSVSPGSVDEDGSTNIVYTFTRTNVLPQTPALTINFDVAGNATFTTDYTQSGATSFTSGNGSMTFPAGVSSLTLTIDPVADEVVEPSEVLTLTVTPSPGSYLVGGNSTATGTILNDDIPPTANAGGPYEVFEGGTVAISGTGHDPGDILALTWDLDGDTTFGETGSLASRGDEIGANVVFNAAGLSGNIAKTITLRVSDGPQTTSSTALVQVLNVAPTANAGGPYTVYEGSSIGLSGTGADAVDTVTLEWDLNNDLIFGQTGETGATPTFSAASINGDSLVTVRLRVTDIDGASVVSTAAVHVLNVPPTANAGGPYTVSENTTKQLAGTGADDFDTVTFTWDLDGDGTFGETGGQGTMGDEVGHSPIFNATSLAATQTRTVTLHVFDGNSTATSTATVLINNRPSISGQKFNDQNNNGERDEDEQGLDGFTIRLVGPGNVTIQTQFTASIDLNLDGFIDAQTESGLYRFTDVSPGNYTIVESPLIGWTQTFPTDGSHSVTINSGQGDEVNFDFGNFKSLGEIHGQKFQDVNRDGTRTGSIISGTDPNVIFIIDVSGSTSSTFRGSPVGNQNSDSASNTILDAEIAGFKALNQKLIDLGYGNSGNVSVVSFSTTAQIRDMNPVLGGVQNTTTPLADANGNTTRDVNEVLSSLTYTGNTNFADALAKAIQIITTNSWAKDKTNVIFLSDGIPSANNFADEAVALGNVAGNVRAFGVGSGASLNSLRIIDGNASIFTTTDQLLNAFGNLTSPNGSTEPGLNGWTIELIDAGGNVTTRVTQSVDINGDTIIDPFTEQGLYSFGNLPAGNYTVREVSQNGWVQTYPIAPGTYSLTLDPGDTLRNIDFGNFQLADINVTVSPDSVNEDGNANLVYTFTRNHTTAATPALTVNFAVGGNATFSNDYSQTGATSFNSTTGSITFAPGNTTATITINPTADEDVEASEVVTLTLTGNSSFYNLGGNSTATGTILNDDVGPIANAGGPYNVDEGGTVAISGTGIDPGDVLTVTWDLDGDGTFGETGVLASRGAETAANAVFNAAGVNGPSTQTITVRVTDGVQVATSNAIVHVLNLPPTANAGGPYSVDEGASVALSGTGADVIDTVVLEWDLDSDGTFGETGEFASRGNETGNNPTFNAAGLSGPSTTTIQLRVTDFDGMSTTGNATIAILNRPPSANAGGPYTVYEGATVALSGTGSDAVDGVTLTWNLDGDLAFGDTGSAAGRGDETGNVPVFKATGLNGPGLFTVTLRVTDDDSASAQSTALIHVVNVAPTPEAGGPYTVNEAGTVSTIVGDATDPVDGTLQFRWDLDADGTFGETGANAARGVETNPGATFNAAGLNGPGTFTITLRVQDDADSATDTALIEIRNVVPMASSGGPYTVDEGGTIGLNGSGTDVIDTLTFTWDLDNDSTFGETGVEASRGNETGNAPVFTADGLNGPSTRTITLSVFDGTDSTTRTTTVIVRNVAPEANARGPYTVDEGSTVELSGTGADVVDTVTLTWDLDNDGTFGETGALASRGNETGSAPVFNAANVSGPGTVTAKLLVTDFNAATALSTATIVVLNKPPTANAGGPYVAEEGGTVALSGTGADVVDAVTLLWDLDGDGTFGETGADASRGIETGNNPVFSAANIIAPAQKTVTLRVNDADLESVTSTALVTVTAVLPSANARGAYTVDEGATVALSGTGSHPTDTVTLLWDFDADGNFGETGVDASRGNEIGATAVYNAATVSGNSTQTVTLLVLDNHDGHATSTAEIYVLNVGPQANAQGPYTVNEGGTVALSGTGSDVVDTVTLEWDLDNNTTFGETGETGPTPIFSAPGVSGPSNATIKLRVTDADGATAISTAEVIILNVAPTANARGPYTVDEGSTVALNGTGADVVDGVTLTWTLDGDTTFGETGGLATRGNETGATPIFSAHLLNGPSSVTVTLRVTDDNGLSTQSTTLIQVRNLPPTAEAGGDYTVDEVGTVAIAGSATDPVDSTFEFRWDLDGDGTFGESGTDASRGIETNSSAIFNATGLNGPGTFTITLRVHDDTHSATDTALIHIRNVPPTANALGPYTVDEGGTVGLSGTGADVIDSVSLLWDLDDDGIFGEIGGVASHGDETGNNPVFVAADLNGPSTFTIKLHVSDGNDATQSTRVVTVLNVPPTANAGGPYTVTEGSTVGLSGTASDVVDSVTLDWDLDGDNTFGATGESGANPVFNAALISGPNTLTVKLRVVDDNGASAISTATIVVQNKPPTANAGGPYFADEGGTVGLAGTGADVVDAVTLLWDLDGDGTFGETGADASRGIETGNNPVYSAANIIAPAQKTITLRVNDADLESVTSTALVTITAVSPTANARGPYTVDEGSTVTLSGTGSHPTDSVSLFWDFDNDAIFGETGAEASRGNEVGAGAVYNAAGVSGNSTQTITLLVVDNHDGQATATAVVHVRNVNPTANAGGPYTVEEGGAVGLLGSGTDAVDSVTLDWDLDGNGTFGEAGETGTSPVFSAAGVSGPATATAWLRVTDADGATALSTAAVTIVNAAPNSNAGGPYTVDEGATIGLAGSGTDAVDDVTLAWDLDHDGTFGETGANASRGNETGVTPTFNATTVSGPSTATVWLRVNDTNGASTTSSTTVTVLNLPPKANAGGPYSVAEGASVGLTGSGTDPVDTIVLSWDLDGDGTFGETGADASRGNETGTAPTFSAAAVNGPTTRTVTLRVTDFNGASTLGTTTVQVGNRAPTANPGGPYFVPENSTVALNGTGGDVIDNVTLTWDLDGNGTFGETGANALRGNETGATPVFNAAGLDGPSSVSVRMRVTDDDGASTTVTVTINVTNLPPNANAGGPYSVDEGGLVGITGTGSDVIDPVTLIWDLDGDGTFGETGVAASRGNEVGVNPIFNAAGLSGPITRIVTLRVSDGDGGSATSLANVIVANLPPSANAGGPYTVEEGSSVTVIGNGSDTSDTVVFSWDLDGDGTFSEIGATAERGVETGQTPTFVATNADGPQTATITLRVTDSDGGTSTSTASVTVLNVPPTANAGGPYSVNEGSNVGLTGTGTDVIDPLTFAWDLDGDGTFGDTGSAAERGNETGPTPLYNTSGLDGTITSTLTLLVTDGDGGSATSITTVTVHNVAPTSSAGAGHSVAEGSSVGLTGTGSDPFDAISFSWDLDGDGTFGETGAAAANGNETGATPVFDAALVDGPFARTVSLRVTDDDGLATTSTAVVEIFNVAPLVDANPGAAYLADVEGTLALLGTFIDPAPADTHSVVWDLDGDGTFGETGAAGVRGDETGLAPTFVANMVSTRNTITLRVTDDDGGVGEDTAIVTIRGGQFDFNKDLTPLDAIGTPSPTQAGYISVMPRDVFTWNSPWGWTRFTGFWPGFDRGPQPTGRPLPDLLRDGHYGTRDSATGDPGANTFHVRLPNDIYNINITMGDQLFTHDMVQVNAEGGLPELTGLSNPAGQWIHRSFTVAVTDGILDLEFSDMGGNNLDWVVNGLDIRTVASLNKSINFATPGAVIADGVTPVTFTAAVTGLADGTLVTIASSAGTIITPDADPATYAGRQVAVVGGTITAQVVTSTLAPITLTAVAVNGQAKGEATASVPSIAAVRRFDFNSNQSNGNITAPGYTSVFPTNGYTPTQGYGWQSTFGVAAFQRDFPAATLSAPLRRDAHYSQTSTTIGSTFLVAAKPATTYNVRVYVGDFAMARSGIQLIIEGVATPVTLPSLAAGVFDTRTTAGAIDTNNDGRISIRIRNTTGAPWVASGIDIWESSVTTPPAVAQLNSDTLVESFGNQPQLTDAQLQPIVAAALDRYTAAGLSAQQAAVLHSLQFQIVDLGASTELGNARPGLIQIDDDAAGHGWYVDSTPGDDDEYSVIVAANELQAPTGSPAAQGMDLLTLVMHELGHELGLDDLDASATPHELMTESIGTGTRRLPPSFVMSSAESDAAGLVLLPNLPSTSGPLANAGQAQSVASAAPASTIQLLAQQIAAQRVNAAPLNSVQAGHRTLKSPSQAREVDALFADWDQT